MEIKIDSLSISADGGRTWKDIPILPQTVNLKFKEPQPPNMVDSTCRVVGTGTAIVKREVNGR